MIIIKSNSLNAVVKKISIHQNQKALWSNVEIRKLKGGYISEVLENDLKLFNKYRAIIISTAPGTGKTTLCEKTIVDFIQTNKKNKIIIVSNRITQDVAIKQRIAKKLNIYNDYNDIALHQMTEFGNIVFLTYQQLKKMIKDKSVSNKDISFAIFDEAHYFTSDATFSKDNGWLLSQIPKMYANSIRIYITATVKDVLPYICSAECNSFANSRWNKRWIQDEYYNKISQYGVAISKEELNSLVSDEQFAYNLPVPILYTQDRDYSHIKLKFYTDDAEAEKVLSENNQKAIIFVETKERGKALQEKFADSEYMDSDTKNKNPEFIGRLTNEEKFNSNLLITTSVFENGCNIKDSDVKTVVVENINPTAIVQMAGRRRKCNPNDTFTLYLKVPTLGHLKQLKYLSEHTLHLINLSETYPNRFMQEIIEPNTLKSISNILTVHNRKYTFDWLTKCVLQDNINYYDELIDCISNGDIREYCLKIAKECFGKEKNEISFPSSSRLNVNELEKWLDSYVLKSFTENELKDFICNFKAIYTSIVGNTNSDNRGKNRQDVKITWFNNRTESLSIPYKLTILSKNQYYLIKI